VQVHPDDSNAPAGKRGKSEAWYILAADQGATIITGVDGPIQIDQIREQVVETAVAAGEVYLVPAGTVHAIGAGVLLYEIQQASDVTWRLYDWGRPRDLHIDEALAAARPEQQATRIEPCRVSEGVEMLVACRYFALQRWHVAGERSLPACPETFRVLTVLDGDLLLGDVRMRRGSSTLLPADLPDQTLRGDGSLLLGFIPDLDADVREPLRAAGHDVESIRRLGTEL
ncbi:MAG: class I mannose-6-phosphate isomerase, partial [Thermomicrobiales bacterium]